MEAPLTPRWHTAFLSAAAAAAPAAPPASLAQILWAAARLKLQAPTAWVEAMVAPLLVCVGTPTGGHPAGSAKPGSNPAAALAYDAAKRESFPAGPHQQHKGTGGAHVPSADLPTEGRAAAAAAGGAPSVPQDLANAVFAVAQLGRGGAQSHPQCKGGAKAHPLLRKHPVNANL
eukprot:1159557-Pelagomonas_calceolata.AAC.12